MTEFNVAAGDSGLADALIAHGGLNYFDQITYNDSPLDQNTRETYLTKDGATITIHEDWSNSSSIAKIDNTSLDSLTTGASNTKFFGWGVETDAAIILFGNSSALYSSSGEYTRPLVICKSQNGGGGVITPVAHSAYGYEPTISSSEGDVRTRTFIVSTSGIKTQWYNGWRKNNNSSNVLNSATFWTPDDVAKDVYFCTDRPLAQKEGPFMLEINGESFASFACNSILVKTT